MPTFCRHNRYFAECPICSKGTVLDPDRQAKRRARPSSVRGSSTGAKQRVGAAARATRSSRGPFASVGPYDGAEIRLERVPGGLRMAAWRGGQIDRVAPVVAAGDLPALIGEAVEKGLLVAGAETGTGAAAAEPGAFGGSPGRTGELRDELRVERLDEARVRVARWILRPNRGWELQHAPVMLPPQRFVQALAAAAGKGVLTPSTAGDPSGSPAR